MNRSLAELLAMPGDALVALFDKLYLMRFAADGTIFTVTDDATETVFNLPDGVDVHRVVVKNGKAVLVVANSIEAAKALLGLQFPDGKDDTWNSNGEMDGEVYIVESNGAVSLLDFTLLHSGKMIVNSRGEMTGGGFKDDGGKFEIRGCVVVEETMAAEPPTEPPTEPDAVAVVTATVAEGDVPAEQAAAIVTTATAIPAEQAAAPPRPRSSRPA